MTAKLYHTQMPSGRALVVAEAIREVAPSLGAGAVKLASDLFAGAYPKKKAAVLKIEAPLRFSHLQEVCRACGIEAST